MRLRQADNDKIIWGPIPNLLHICSGGGGEDLHMYAYWVCAARETPIFSPEFSFRSISFSQITPKNPFRSITI